MYKKASTVFAFSDVIMAALFFEYVVPLTTYIIDFNSSLEDVVYLKTPKYKVIDSIKGKALLYTLTEITHPSLLDSNGIGFSNDYLNFIIHLLPFLIADPVSSVGDKVKMGEAFLKSVKKLIISIGEPIDMIGSPDIKNYSDIEDLCISLKNLDLIDTTKITWNQVLEFRKDRESKQKLRNLRLFLYENYKGKSKNYVEDSILKKIDEYNRVVRKWGMETTEAALNIVFSSKSAIALWAAAFAGSLVGGTSPVTALVGLTFEFGLIGLEISKKMRELTEFKLNDPVSYIIDIKNLEEKD